MGGERVGGGGVHSVGPDRPGCGGGDGGPAGDDAPVVRGRVRTSDWAGAVMELRGGGGRPGVPFLFPGV